MKKIFWQALIAFITGPTIAEVQQSLRQWKHWCHWKSLLSTKKMHLELINLYVRSLRETGIPWLIVSAQKRWSTLCNNLPVCVCRDVKIYRLISKNSIEEAMLHCAEKKLKLEMDVTGSNNKGSTYIARCLQIIVIV